MQATRRFPHTFRVRVPRGLPAAVDLAARQNHTTPAEWARQALLSCLAADGVHLRDGAIVEGHQREEMIHP